MRRFELTSVAVLASGLLAAPMVAAETGPQLAQMGPGMGQGYGMGGHPPGHQGNPVRHRVVRMGGGIPAPYTDISNPRAASPASIASGRALYGEHCASCHGVKGAGDGAAGGGLEPKPANLAFIMHQWIATDGLLMWAISEGGEPLGTAMPAFKATLSEEQRWEIVDFLRGGLGS